MFIMFKPKFDMVAIIPKFDMIAVIQTGEKLPLKKSVKSPPYWIDLHVLITM